MADGKIIVYLTRWCFDCRRATDYLTRNNVPFEAINIDLDQEGDHFVRQVNNGFRSVPTVIFPDGSTLVEPSLKILAEKLAILNLA